MNNVFHELKPIYDSESKVLILGTIPSPKSRKIGFYYAHPQNRFWKVMEDLFDESLHKVEDKINFLHRNHIALWDVLSSCIIKGASDASIAEENFNPIDELVKKTKIETIFCTGKKAYIMYQKHIYPKTKMEAFCLPSTSPANCAIHYEDLKEAYAKIKEYCYF